MAERQPLTEVAGTQAIVTYSEKPGKKGAVTYDIVATRADSGKPLGKRSLTADVEGFVKSLDLRINFFSNRYLILHGRLKGAFDYGSGREVADSPHLMKFWRDHASYPFQSHELWFLTEDIRWGKFAPDTDVRAMVAAVNREDIWRDAAAALTELTRDYLPEA